MSTEKEVIFDGSVKPKQGILQKSHNYEEHETPQHKIRWDENKLKWNEKQQEQVTMKVDEPNTPFVRYDAVSDKVTNWQDLPASLRNANEIPEDDDFALDSEPTVAMKESSKMDRWDLEDETEEKEKQSKAEQKHEAFLKKRAQHYYHDGYSLHK